MAYQYPASDLDSAQTLLNVLGDFWAQSYAGVNLVESLVYAAGRIEEQTHLDLLDLVASLSRFKVPVFHRENWYLLTLRESQRNQGEANLPKLDGSYQLDSGLVLDEPVPTVYSTWDVAAGLVDAPLVMNRITSPTLTLTQGLDYFFRDGAIWLRDNPFDDERVSVREVFSGNAVVDRECALWVYRGRWDWGTVYQQFGYAIGLHLRSSEGYKELVNAIYDGLTEGTSVRCIQQAFSAIADVPLARTQETVEHVLSDSRGQVVVTDQNAYRIHRDAQVLVSVGDTLVPGASLSDTLRFYEFNRGQLPAADEIRALAMGRGFLAAGYLQDLVFENKDVSLVVEENVDGYTKISFPLGGFPPDVEKFWEDVHAAGVAAGQTLAMLLDRRPTEAQTTQPGPGSLPATINPLGFLAENVLRNHVVVVRVKPGQFGPRALGTAQLRMLRKLMPPHTACIVLVTLAMGPEEVIMDGPGTPTRAGYEENVSLFLGMRLSEVIDPNLITETLTLRRIGGRCQ